MDREAFLGKIPPPNPQLLPSIVAQEDRIQYIIRIHHIRLGNVCQMSNLIQFLKTTQKTEQAF